MTTTTTEMTTNTCVEMTTPVINLQTPVGKEKPLAAKYKNYTKFAYWFMKRLQTEEIIGESQVGDAVKALGVYLKSTKDKQIIFDDFENDAKQLDAELKQMVKIHENPNYKPRKRAPKKAKVDEEPVKDTVKENMNCVVKELQEVIEEAVEEPVKEFVEETIQQVIEEQDEEQVEDQLEEAVEDQLEEQVEDQLEEAVEAVEEAVEAVEEAVEAVEGTPPKKERKKSSKKKKVIVVQDDIVAQIVEAANACRIDASEPKVKKPRKKSVSVGDEALIEDEKSTDQVPKTLDDVADDVVTPELELEEYVK